jgi:ATP-binding cassette subfamily B (MDR/TAP) protein 1
MCCKIKLNKNWFKILQVFFAITMSAVGVSQSTSRSADLTKVKIAVNSIFEIIDLKSKIDPLEKSGKTMKAVKGEVELQHISFTYPTRPTMPIFKDLNLIVQAGTVSNLLHLTRKKKSH